MLCWTSRGKEGTERKVCVTMFRVEKGIKG